jgi:putative transposase
MSTKFPKLLKDILKPLPKNDRPVLNTFSLYIFFVSCWIGFALFSKVSKIREIDVFEKIIAKLNKRFSIKEGVEKARALFPIYSTVISLTSKLLWQEKWHQVKLFCGLNSITSEVGGIQHFWLFNVSPIFFFIRLQLSFYH